MNDDWLKYMDNTMIVGAVWLYFSAAFDVIDHHLFLKNSLALSSNGRRVTYPIEPRECSSMG
jgi:hypothetical protein